MTKLSPFDLMLQEKIKGAQPVSKVKVTTRDRKKVVCRNMATGLHNHIDNTVTTSSKKRGVIPDPVPKFGYSVKAKPLSVEVKLTYLRDEISIILKPDSLGTIVDIDFNIPSRLYDAQVLRKLFMAHFLISFGITREGRATTEFQVRISGDRVNQFIRNFVLEIASV